ncbi:endonuclease domain-containing protein [Carboxylicivirga mesophila]|uniref:Endonuclease domain-containing protein n=1 Tax=Carboxylicivirga mesophila TaxID=1166478 RepID=A0ABS5KAV8_9BACT|nr:endonuclease domain-containing protein [Carboxylicivirga mesophila]MBS2212007.1 endonuclease domain-containing protein [Carboxylicivirga mesophila]
MNKRSIPINMFYGAKPNTFEKAKMLRKNMTIPEKILWEYLRNKKIFNLRFRAQHPIDIFIADFYCHQLKLIIEIDGKTHLSKKEQEYDIDRTAEFQHYGITVIRFTNEQVLGEIHNVIRVIEEKCKSLFETTPNP